MTLGAHEVDDLAVAVSHVRERHPDSTIGLWGRSMGAVTALLYSQRDPSIAGVVRACLCQWRLLSAPFLAPLWDALSSEADLLALGGSRAMLRRACAPWQWLLQCPVCLCAAGPHPSEEGVSPVGRRSNVF